MRCLIAAAVVVAGTAVFASAPARSETLLNNHIESRPGDGRLVTEQAPVPTVESVVEAAARYVKAYQTQLSAVVAEEVYTQQVASLVPSDPAIPRFRRITGELFFMTAPGGDDWLAIRDIATVDGQALKNRLTVLEELKRLPVHEVVAAFKASNSKFNIGRTSRNFNEPTLSLRVLDGQHRSRFSFVQRRVERSRDGPIVVVAFTERDGPSLIRDLTYGAALSKGEFSIEPASGRVQRAVLTAAVGPVRLELVTDYALDKRLELWLPSRFRERYEHGRAPRSVEASEEHEDISCEATYANYKGFETSGRIKK